MANIHRPKGSKYNNPLYVIGNVQIFSLCRDVETFVIKYFEKEENNVNWMKLVENDVLGYIQKILFALRDFLSIVAMSNHLLCKIHKLRLVLFWNSIELFEVIVNCRGNVSIHLTFRFVHWLRNQFTSSIQWSRVCCFNEEY